MIRERFSASCTFSPSRSTSFVAFEMIQIRYASTSSLNGLPSKERWRSFFSLSEATCSLNVFWSQPSSLCDRSNVESCCSDEFLKFSQPSRDVSESGRVPIRLCERLR